MATRSPVETRPITVKDIMSANVITVRDDMTVQEVATFLTENQISGAPVEDAEGRVIGVVSFADIARATTEAGMEEERAEPDFFARGWEEVSSPEDFSTLHVEAPGLTARDIMTPSVFSIADDQPISGVARLMIDAHIHRVLVTQDHKLVGIITTSDLLSLLTEAS
jgi:predicted transcriptional regulator